MRFFQSALIALTALVAPLCVAERVIDSSNVSEEFALLQKWSEFKVQFNKVYATAEEEAHRFDIFSKNMARAAELNAENPNASFGVTRFVDLSPAEFHRQYLNYKPELSEAAIAQRKARPVQSPPRHVPRATNVDWRTKGAVTPVKDQGSCGSCWAFSAVEGVESAWFLKHNTLPVLAPQQVVDCDKQDAGCDGGDLPPAFEYIEQKGLQTEASYPYKGTDGTCKYAAGSVVAKISNFTYATPACFDSCNKQDEATLLNNLAATGPSSICVYAGNSAWQLYQSGVYSGSCSHAYSILDHCVQLVGYQSATESYWIVRNSWGTSWGEKGYIYLAYGKNQCGVADEATFAIAA